jgi:translation initiation factor 4E
VDKVNEGGEKHDI